MNLIETAIATEKGGNMTLMSIIIGREVITMRMKMKVILIPTTIQIQKTMAITTIIRITTIRIIIGTIVNIIRTIIGIAITLNITIKGKRCPIGWMKKWMKISKLMITSYKETSSHKPNPTQTTLILIITLTIKNQPKIITCQIKGIKRKL
jgi:hypothetical protein